MTRALLPLTCSALLFVACDGGKKEEGASTSTAAPAKAEEAPKAQDTPEADAPTGKQEAKPEADAPAKESSKPKPSIEKKSRKELEKTRTTARGHLDSGRKLVKEKKYAEGIAAYRKALEIDPRYGPALGELGWAYYRSGDLDNAHHYTSRALAKATDNKRIGMLEYNLGRIAEDRKLPDLAAGHYARSLEARPNETVQGRYDALKSGGAVEVPAHSGGRGVSLLSPKPLPTMEAACDMLRKESMCEGLEACSFHTTAKGKTRAGIVEMSDFIGECYHPVLEGPGGWWLFQAPLAGQLGSEIEQRVSELKAEWADERTIVFRFEDYAYERMSMWEMDELEAEGEEVELGDAESKGLIVCRVFEDDVGCTMAYRNEFSGDATVSQDGSYTATLKVEGDSLIVSEVKASMKIETVEPDGEWEMAIFLREGKYALEDLMARK